MESGKTYLTIAGIIASVAGCFMFLFSKAIGIGILVIGALLLIFAVNVEDYQKNKIFILIGTIVLLIFCPLAGVFGIVAIDKLGKANFSNAPPDKKKTKESKEKREAKRIDLLLKLGVLMVGISGLLFATSQWDIIDNSIKCLILFIMGAIFLFLYKFTKDRLKLISSSNTYWILGMLFFVFTFVAVCYFGVINTWFTYSGEGMYLVYTATFVLASILSLLTSLKLKIKWLMYVSYGLIYLAMISIFKFVNLDNWLISCLMGLISLGILLLLNGKKDKCLYKFNKFIAYFYCIIIWIFARGILALPSIGIGIVLMLYVLLGHKDKNINLLIPIIIYALGVTVLFVMESGNLRNYIFVGLINLVYLLVISIKKKKKSISLTNDIVYNLIMLVTLWGLYYSTSTILFFIATIVYLVINMMVSSGAFKFDNSKIVSYASIIGVWFFTCSCFKMINRINFVNEHLFLVLLIIYYIIGYLVVSGKKLQKIYLIIIMVLTYFCIFYSIEWGLFASVGALIGLVYLVYCLRDRKDVFYIINCILCIIMISVVFINNSLLGLSECFNAFVVLWLYLIILFFTKKDSILRKIVLLALVIPMLSFINAVDSLTSFEVVQILYNIMYFYILYLVLRFFVKKPYYNLLSLIGVIICMLHIIFVRGIYTGTYIGIISIIIMLIGYKNKDCSYLFKAGFIFIIFNILYQLKDLWGKIPFWLYLLVGGLGLITFVTILELKKTKKDD